MKVQYMIMVIVVLSFIIVRGDITLNMIMNVVVLKEVSHENQEGLKAVSIERSSFKDVSAGSFL